LLFGTILTIVGILYRPDARLATGESHDTNGSPAPVLLELFTSEGCSSCPPADALLRKLDEAGSVGGVPVIVVEEHVDYWNHLGWSDPYSSANWTSRQERYAEVFRRDGIYTPQLVVNGQDEFVGSAEGLARRKIADARSHPSAILQLSVAPKDQKSVQILARVESIPAEAAAAQLWLAIAESGLSSHVERGENEGRVLAHAPVLRSLQRLDAARPADTSLTASASLALDTTWRRENIHFVIFLQDPKSLRIYGAAAATAR
jgi:hypothetical protein